MAIAVFFAHLALLLAHQYKLLRMAGLIQVAVVTEFK